MASSIQSFTSRFEPLNFVSFLGGGKVTSTLVSGFKVLISFNCLCSSSSFVANSSGVTSAMLKQTGKCHNNNKVFTSHLSTAYTQSTVMTICISATITRWRQYTQDDGTTLGSHSRHMSKTVFCYHCLASIPLLTPDEVRWDYGADTIHEACRGNKSFYSDNMYGT